ncbi:MAG: hypothetical protein RIS09_211 [Actinomycetota bacterium]
MPKVSPNSCTSLLEVFESAQITFRKVLGHGELKDALVSSFVIWPCDPKEVTHTTVLLVPYHQNLADFISQVGNKFSKQVVIFPGADAEALLGHEEFFTNAAIVTDDSQDLISLIQNFTAPEEVEVTQELRRLVSLQRTYSQALASQSPLSELLTRLTKATNAVCLIVDFHGRVQENTGSLPLSLFLEQITKTKAKSQQVSVEGWHGHAIGLHDTEGAQGQEGWLIVASRREGFPSEHDTAAIHIVATLVEAARKMRHYAEQQKNAIRSSILEEALSLEPLPGSPELASRIAATGIDLRQACRVVVAATSGLETKKSRQKNLEYSQASFFQQMLDDAVANYLFTSRDSTFVALIQIDSEPLQRLIRVNRDALSNLTFGIGRDVNSVIEIVDSYEDALLAIQTVKARKSNDLSMSSDQFDFASSVFSSAGLEKMAKASKTYLSPVMGKEPIMEALRYFFKHQQNANLTADQLGIHHNTLRYRLAKVEELLGINLSDPAAIASIFLALTAIDLTEFQEESTQSSKSGSTRNNQIVAKAVIPVEDLSRNQTPFGATFSPEVSDIF